MKPLVRLGAKPGDCWDWIGRVSEKTGYGKKQWHGRTLLAHRWVWQMFFGDIPDGMVINHLCRNRKCVNPEHLEVTTQAGNCRAGAGTKLTAEQVREIKSASSDRRWGKARHDLAKRFNVSRQLVNDIWAGRAWRDI